DETGSASAPVRRKAAVGVAAGDATGWLNLGKDECTIEVRGVTMAGFRVDPDNSPNKVLHYKKDIGTFASSVVVETKQTYEDDDQAGIITTITGTDYIKKMVSNEAGDQVRLRIVTAGVDIVDNTTAGVGVFMSVSKRSQQ
ncbi:MAG: hypothetical protein AB8B85_01885, partial [Paracoccaceae bacterium]